MIVARTIHKRVRVIDNGENAVERCVFRNELKPQECGAITDMPSEAKCRRCAFFKTRQQFEDDAAKAALSLAEKGLEPCLKLSYDGRTSVVSTRPVARFEKEESHESTDSL